MSTKNKCLNLQQNCSIGFDHFIGLYHFSQIIIDLGLGIFDNMVYNPILKMCTLNVKKT